MWPVLLGWGPPLFSRDICSLEEMLSISFCCLEVPTDGQPVPAGGDKSWVMGCTVRTACAGQSCDKDKQKSNKGKQVNLLLWDVSEGAPWLPGWVDATYHGSTVTVPHVCI